jgi:hypothetical protein
VTSLQSNIETTGYRSLKEGEEVEFDLVVADDGKKKAFRVTGPDGAPPQVCRQSWRAGQGSAEQTAAAGTFRTSNCFAGQAQMRVCLAGMAA